METINTLLRSSLEKPYLIPDQNGQSVYPFSDQNGAKTLPDGVEHTYTYIDILFIWSLMAYIREYTPPAPLPLWRRTTVASQSRLSMNGFPYKFKKSKILRANVCKKSSTIHSRATVKKSFSVISCP